jgi:hypothetical protein
MGFYGFQWKIKEFLSNKEISQSYPHLVHQHVTAGAATNCGLNVLKESASPVVIAHIRMATQKTRRWKRRVMCLY